MPTYWQIAAGSDQRDYSDLFLKYGIAFTGGELEERVNLGDIMVLRQGRKAITAVGAVVERDGIYKGYVDKEGYVVDREGFVNKERRKEWLLDYDGWVLPEFCYVDWKKPNEPIPVGGLNMGRAIQGLKKKEPRAVADDILDTRRPIDPSTEPSETREVDYDDILNFLIKEGLRPSSSDEITSTISKIKLLADYYYNQYGYPWKDLREHEIRTFLVIPLLLALGWSEQQIKIELKCKGGKIDIACFRKPCKRKNREEWKKECVAIIETKSFGAGLDYAHKQVKTYSEDFPNCQAVIATNGYCYKIYLRQGNTFQTTPSAYINMLKPRDRYPLDPENVGGALKAIKWLLPNNLVSISYQNTSRKPE